MTQGCHMSDFHRVTQYGSNICHASVSCVTCDTTCHEQGVPIMEISYTMYHFVFKWSWKDPPSPPNSIRESQGLGSCHFLIWYCLNSPLTPCSPTQGV